MAKITARTAAFLGIAIERRLCTAPPPQAAQARGAATWEPLYRRLSLSRYPGHSVADTMNGWLREGRAVTETEVIKYVKSLRKYKNNKTALELMDWMEKRGMKMSISNHAIRLDLISKVKGIDLAESYFSNLPDIAKNQLTYATLLNSYCQEKMESKAVALYGMMKELNFTSYALVQNMLMTMYMKLGQPKKIPDLFQEMIENNISPDIITYSILMNSYASLNDIESAEKVIDDMKEAGITLHWSIYSNLASCYVSAGLFQKAEFTLQKLENVMDKHNREPYAFLISLYASIGNSMDVIRVWKSLKAHFAKITNKNYLVMFQALYKLDDFDALKQCFEEWQSTYTIYDIRLTNMMIRAYLRKDMIEEAKALWEKALQKSTIFNFQTFKLFINYYLKERDMNLALKCLESAAMSLKNQEWKPDKEMLNEFVKYFEEVKDVDGIESFCKSLKKLNCPDAETFESLLHKY